MGKVELQLQVKNMKNMLSFLRLDITTGRYIFFIWTSKFWVEVGCSNLL